MMCCCFLLLLTLTSCVCEPTFVVKVTQSSYQAEENHNITLDWTFTSNTQGSLDSLIVFCELFTEDRVSVLYHLREGDEDPEIQDEQFSGRVQCDRDVLREGRVRLHVSRLRTEDSGWYQCEVFTEYGRGSDECHLNVTEAVDEPGPETPGPERPGPETPGPQRPGPETPGPQRPGPEGTATVSEGKVGFYLGLIIAAAVFLVLSLRYCAVHLHLIKDEEENVTAAETQSLYDNQPIRSTWTLSGPPSSVVSTEPEPKNLETESRTVSGSSTAGDVT